MSKQYYERYWQDQEILSDFGYKWPVIKKLLPPDHILRFLDFGCGKAIIGREIVTIRPSYKYYGVDISKNALRSAKKLIPTGNYRIISTNQRIPFPSNFFDFILASDVLEHIYDTKIACNELARVLKKNGILIITVPYNGKLKLIAAILVAFDSYFDPYSPHIRYFSKSTVSRCLRDVQLNPIKFGYYGRWYPFSNGIYVVATKNLPLHNK